MMDIDWSSIISLLIPGGIGALITALSKSGREKAQAEAAKAKSEAAKAKVEARDAQITSYETALEHSSEREAKLHAQLDDLQAKDYEKTQLIRKHVEEISECEATINKLYERNLELEREVGRLKLDLEKKRCDDIPCPFRIPPTAYTLPRMGQTKEEYHKSKSAINLDKDQTSS